MKTIGVIGGMSWESTALYYQLLNQGISERLGGFHSARLILYSVDFHDIENLQARGAWDAAGDELAKAGRALERAGADFLVIATNTMHKVADAITAAVRIPLLHIADPTTDAALGHGLKCVGLLGTRFTMEEEFYRSRLERRGLAVVTPPESDRELVHHVIFNELCRGEVREDSRRVFRRIIEGLVATGAEGVILGCTEIGMLIGRADSPVVVFDTTRLHAAAAVDYALTGAVPD